MTRRHQRPAAGAASVLLVAALTLPGVALTLPGVARAETRDQVMARARAFAYHPWRCASANVSGAAGGCGGGYQSVYSPGDYLGLPYDWGGYMSLFQFDQRLAQGYGAGSYPDDGILDCTVGLDCSGYVSQCWQSGYYQTSNLAEISTAISQQSMLPGDVFNQAGYHVILFEQTLANGDPLLYESAGYNVHVNASGGWSYVSGYTPRRYNGITGTTAGTPVGTTENPILIGSFPYTDSRDTRQAASDVLDGCGASPTKNESGPEYIYEVTFTQPGTLTATISDDADTDVDIHLYTSLNTNDCVARNDATISVAVDCGTYYLVADTFRSSGGTEYPGPYTLTATFTASGGACGAGPPTYNFGGELGDACGYPGHESLPFCNPNLGAETCIYTTSPPQSFCSTSCTGPADCAIFPGGCCAELQSGEHYCIIASLCGATTDGGTLIDAGVMPQDAAPPGDALVLLDGAGVVPDGGSTPDGGAPSGGDGGDGGPGTGGGGCRAAATSSGLGAAPLALLAGLLLGASRRRGRARRRPR